MKLMTEDIIKKLPGLYETEELSEEETMVWVKYFTPDGQWSWYGIEYNPETRVFFGLVKGFVAELGYFSLTELESVRGPMGLGVERDVHFEPVSLARVRRGCDVCSG